MQTASFWIDHIASNSRAVVEFGLVKGKVKLVAFGFLRGNVIDLTEVYHCRKQAVKFLANGGRWHPFSG